MAYSTSVINVCFVDASVRASQATTGTCGSTERASRTSSRSCCNSPSNVLTPTMYGSLRSSKKSIGANESSSLRVSANTTEPIAPRTRSSHMNQKRCCPGVPNRYRMRSRSNETRPKSIATVVLDLFGVASRLSMPVLASVMTASVVNGTISDTEPTNVVLPAPKPPATIILADVIVAGAESCPFTCPDCCGAWPFTAPPTSRVPSKPPESTQNPFHQRQMFFGTIITGHRLVHRDKTPVGGVTDQYPGNTDRNFQHSSQLCQ